MRLLMFAAATVLTAGSSFAADPELVSLALPDSHVMAGVNFEQARLSPLGQYLMAQTGQLFNGGLDKLIETTGFDPRRDLREILMSASGLKPNGPTIVMARGTFDIPRILEASLASGATSETYKGVPMVVRAANGTMAFPDSTTAIIGETAQVRAAIDRRAAPAAIGAALAAQVSQLSATEDAWFVSTVSLAQLQPIPTSETGTGPSPFALASKVQQASGGVKLGANVVLSLQAVSQTEQDAATLAASLQSLASMAQLSAPKGELASAAALLQSLTVTADGKTTDLSLSVPESQLEQMMQAAHTNERHQAMGVDPGAQPSSPAGPGLSTGPAPQRVRVSGDVQKAKLLQHPDPVYPPLAEQARISGVVRLNVIIGKDGAVENVTVLSGHPVLVPSAIEAVKQWTYAPTRLNGSPVEVATQVEVSFKRPQ